MLHGGIPSVGAVPLLRIWWAQAPRGPTGGANTSLGNVASIRGAPQEVPQNRWAQVVNMAFQDMCKSGEDPSKVWYVQSSQVVSRICVH